MRQLNASVLNLRSAHVEELGGLAALHGDPFDRTLMCQALGEWMTLLSTDRQVGSYRSARLRIKG